MKGRGASPWVLFSYPVDNIFKKCFLAKQLSPAAYGSKSTVLQQDTVQRVRELGTLSPKWDVAIKSAHSHIGELCGRGG